MTDTTDTDQLRDHIAAALSDHLARTADIRPGRDGELAFMPEVTDSEGLRIASAVLAALPAPALTVARQVLGTTTGQPATAPTVTRAMVLREAANGLAALGPLDSLVSAPAAWAEAIEALRRMADQMTEDDRSRMADEQPEAEAESCGRFVPDTPRAPGLCASCGDARGWHSRMADEAQQPTPAPAEETKPEGAPDRQLSATCSCGHAERWHLPDCRKGSGHGCHCLSFTP